MNSWIHLLPKQSTHLWLINTNMNVDATNSYLLNVSLVGESVSEHFSVEKALKILSSAMALKVKNFVCICQNDKREKE